MYDKKGKLDKDIYEEELEKLHRELIKLQYWIKEKGLRVAVIFEGRDAAGKGGVIKRITEVVNPRIVRVVALQKPTETERTQCIFNDTSNTCLQRERWCYSIVAGTIGLEWNE